MCRWHKLAAKDAATDPITGNFNTAKYAVALTAMGLLRVEQKQWGLEQLFEIDGFNPEEILTTDIQTMYSKSPYAGQDMELLKASFEKSVDIMRAALDKIENDHDYFTADNLNIPKGVTIDGYKESCCKPANPRDNGPFLDAAVVYLAKGYDDEKRSFASKPLELVTADELVALFSDPTIPENDRAYLPDLIAIREYTEHFLAEPDVKNALETAFSSSVSYIFDTAKDDLDKGLGLSGPSDCIMCEGAKGRKSNPPENKPR